MLCAGVEEKARAHWSRCVNEGEDSFFGVRTRIEKCIEGARKRRRSEVDIVVVVVLICIREKCFVRYLSDLSASRISCRYRLTLVSAFLHSVTWLDISWNTSDIQFQNQI